MQQSRTIHDLLYDIQVWMIETKKELDRLESRERSMNLLRDSMVSKP